MADGQEGGHLAGRRRGRQCSRGGAYRGLHQLREGPRVGSEGSGLPDRAVGALQRERGGLGYRQGPRCDGEGRGGAARAAHAARGA
eukprot:14958500-Alexandrium_andersonii.AAC.1